MKRSNRLVLLIGIFLALVAFVLVLVTLKGNGVSDTGTPTASPTTVSVVVASTDIALGSKITQGEVTTKLFAIDQRPGDSYTDPSLVIGKTVRQSVSAGQYISSATLGGAGGTLTDIEVPAGFVGISVQVDQVTGVGTLIKAGDRVDVVIGLTGTDKVPLVVASPVPSPRGGATPAPAGYGSETLPYNSTTVKTLVEGIQVLGTLLPPPTTAAQPAASGSTGGTSLNGQQEIVILAVTAQQAEIIKFSQMQGDVSLVLRATADCQSTDGSASPCPTVATTGITLRVLVDSFGILPPQVLQVIQPAPYPSPKR